MKFLPTQVAKEARKTNRDYIRARIADLPKIVKTIEQNKGGRTKYLVSVLLCSFCNFSRGAIFSKTIVRFDLLVLIS